MDDSASINIRSLRTEYRACSRSARKSFPGAIEGRAVFGLQFIESRLQITQCLIRQARSERAG